MGSYRTFVHYVRKKNIYILGSYTAKKLRVKNEILRFLKFLSSSTCTSRLAFLDLTPDSSSCPRQLLRAYFRSKRAKREVYELDPPLLGPQPRILVRTIWALAIKISEVLVKRSLGGRFMSARAFAKTRCWSCDFIDRRQVEIDISVQLLNLHLLPTWYVSYYVRFTCHSPGLNGTSGSALLSRWCRSSISCTAIAW